METSLLILAVSLVILSAVPVTDAFGGKACKNTSQCTEPTKQEFCDPILGVCLPCDRECTGIAELEKNCKDKCLKKYLEVYVNTGAPTTPALVISTDKDLKENKKSETSNALDNPKKNDKPRKSVNGGAVAGVCVAMVMVSTGFVAVAAVWVKKRKTSRRHSLDDNSSVDSEASMPLREQPGPPPDPAATDGQDPRPGPPTCIPGPTPTPPANNAVTRREPPSSILDQADYEPTSKHQCLPSGSSHGFDIP